MAETVENQIAVYVRVLDDIRFRAEAAQFFLDQPKRMYPMVEAAALQVRFMLELVALGSFAANRDLVAKVTTAYAKKDPNDALKILKKINPDFWPKPYIVEVDPAPGVRGRLAPATGPYVTESQWGSEFGQVSSLVHAQNPFKKQQHDLSAAYDQVQGLLLRMTGLLNVHMLKLKEPNVSLLARMLLADGHPHVYVSTQQPDGRWTYQHFET